MRVLSTGGISGEGVVVAAGEVDLPGAARVARKGRVHGFDDSVGIKDGRGELELWVVSNPEAKRTPRTPCRRTEMGLSG